jgi:hypothetical protein
MRFIQRGKIFTNKKYFLFLFLILLLIGFIQLSSALTNFYDDIVITVHDDLTYDISLSEKFDCRHWSKKNYAMTLDANLTNPVFSDLEGEIKVNKLENITNETIKYRFDTNYDSCYMYLPVFMNSTNNKMYEFNDYISSVNFYKNIRYTRESDEYLNITLVLPDSLTFLSAIDYEENKINHDKIIHLNYKNPLNDFIFVFIKTKSLDKFVEIKDADYLYLVENNPKLVDSFNKIIKEKDLILNYPKGDEDLIIISEAEITEGFDAIGAYFLSDLILVDKNLTKYDLNEFVQMVLLHELTHHASHKYFDFNPATWFDEGISVYSEIRYLDKHYPNFTAYYTPSTELYFRKPEYKTLVKWYYVQKGLDDDYEINFSGSERYSIYGFLINNYAKKYGQDKLEESIEKLNQEFSERMRHRFYHIDAGILIRASFIEVSEDDYPVDEFFFPERELFLNDRGKFIEKMRDLMTPEISPEETEELKKEYSEISKNESLFYGGESDSSKVREGELEKSQITWIVVLLIIVGLVVLIIVFVYFKFFKK